MLKSVTGFSFTVHRLVSSRFTVIQLTVECSLALGRASGIGHSGFEYPRRGLKAANTVIRPGTLKAGSNLLTSNREPINSHQ